MKSMLKDAAILLLITLIAGLLLGGVYQITREPIALAEEKAVQEAYSMVFPQASGFKDMDIPEQDAVFDNDWKEAGFEGVQIDGIISALDGNGDVAGYVLKLTSHKGYGGDISFAMGIQKDGTLNGISILSISETAGLGMKAESELVPQFAQKKVSSFSYTKIPAAVDSQIDVISGATITTNALVTAVNGGLYYFQAELGGGVDE